MYQLMPTGYTRSKRYVPWRVSQQPARQYNRRVRNTPATADIPFVSNIDEIRMHNCPVDGKSFYGTNAEYREIHNH